MARDLILGTAGHIDHGKTALVRALTGVDGDRLPEEKARGITINLGFAYLDLGGHRLGVVDVPGHERYVKNMLAGATGMDLALLVVAADDSVMPQTREHLAILQHLGVAAGVVALTKADLADEFTLELVESELRDFTRGTFLADAAVVPVSSRTGRGLEALKAELLTLCGRVRAPAAGPFRLGVDRAFVAEGHGPVATGTVRQGSVRVGDRLDWFAGGLTRPVRVRGLASHGRAVDELHAGMRGALNLAGEGVEALGRGQELAAPGSLRAARWLSVELKASADAPRPLRHRLPVRLHLGTAEVSAKLALLDCDRVEPGGAALAQLLLAEALPAAHGQRFVLRSDSAEETLAGGRVLQPEARRLRRRQFDALTRLEMLQSADPAARAEAAVWFAGYEGSRPADWHRLAGVADESGVMQALAGRVTPAAGGRTLAAAWRERGETLIVDHLRGLHAANPLASDHDRAAVTAAASATLGAELAAELVAGLLRGKRLVGDARRVALAEFKPKLTAAQRKLKDKIVEAYRAGGPQPPDPGEFTPPGPAKAAAAALADIFEVAAAEGHLVKIAPELYLHADAYAAARAAVVALVGECPATMAELRDALGTTRKFAIPLAEHFDKLGVTARDGDLRRPGPALAPPEGAVT